MKINLGSGYKRYDGFLNVDGDPLTNPDYLVDIETGNLPFENDSIEEVKAYHILEHVGPGFYHLMQEIYRVCKDTAILDIQVPHHRSEVWYGDPSHIRFITIDNMRLFSKKYNIWHIGQWNSSSGFGLKLNVDFEIIEFFFKPAPHWAERFKSLSQDEIIEVSRNFNNVYDETWIKMMVMKNES